MRMYIPPSDRQIAYAQVRTSSRLYPSHPGPVVHKEKDTPCTQVYMRIPTMELKLKTAPERKRFAPRSDNPTISIPNLRINPKTIKKSSVAQCWGELNRRFRVRLSPGHGRSSTPVWRPPTWERNRDLSLGHWTDSDAFFKLGPELANTYEPLHQQNERGEKATSCQCRVQAAQYTSTESFRQVANCESKARVHPSPPRGSLSASGRLFGHSKQRPSCTPRSEDLTTPNLHHDSFSTTSMRAINDQQHFSPSSRRMASSECT